IGVDPWGGRFDGHQPIVSIRAVPHDQTPPARVRAAGRIVLRRGMGKAHFLQLQDSTGRIQVMLGQRQVGETGWAVAQQLDLGDLLGVDGTLQLTRTGELTIFADAVHFLGKSLLPHPDKWSGMQEIEFRLRRRYLDLIYSPEVLERAQQRIKIVRCIRNYLDQQGYQEVETPTLQAIAGGAAARPFVTHHNTLDIDLYLRIALELYLKRLLVGGFDRVYEINRNFRNEGISTQHNPEFTMLEFYEAYSNYQDLIGMNEQLFALLAKNITGSTTVKYGGVELDFSKMQRLSMREAIVEYWPAHLGAAPTVKELAEPRAPRTLGEKYYPQKESLTDGEWTGLVFEIVAEDKLIQPTI